MEKLVGIWIDTKKAIIVTLDGKKEAKITEIDSKIENRMYHNKESDKGTFSGNRNFDNKLNFDRKRNEQMNHYLDAVTNYIKGSNSLYIFGPAEVKIKLEQRIHNEKPPSKITLKGVETANSMPLNQIVAQVKDFYNQLQRKAIMLYMI
ncbi:hypothetical protein [Flavobacterium cellulosilyticum]|uniref:Host attachment protein n=1 Tax=Flavobacterium cellulosilyticum TaxID=2541731 RepID=A0A4R5CHG1_9FLAO|nr:hypothetical protein [Flavobacterium cellulosilyticum]TDD99571.1 hypothetical protein E0F76_02260 [Flavobacterium cellulosilyticum]